MKVVITGVGDDGRSKVVRVVEVDGAPPESGFTSEELLALPAVADAFSDRPRSTPRRPLTCGPGDLSWRLVSYRPEVSIDLHRTDTLDCDLVVRGEIVLGLQAEEIPLGPGDMAVIPGVAHSWRAGVDGCVLSAVLIGLLE
jgi:quercetin dioxygenase-like cupin family protein